MKVVTPYRPFVPESGAHLKLGPFDWPGAVRMLRASVRRSCGCETHLLTAAGEDPIGATHAYPTGETRLMLWILDACLSYLRSDDFDDDTVMLSPDTLVTADLSWVFTTALDLGLMVRPGHKYRDKPLLNGCQFWRLHARTALIDLYASALDLARLEPPSSIRWGADTAPLVALLAPLKTGTAIRRGLTVYGFPAAHWFRPYRDDALPRTMSPVVDFKGVRKRGMAECFGRLGLVA